MTQRPGKTQRMIDYAIGAARQGRKIVVVCNDTPHGEQLRKRITEEAVKAGCPWVIGADSTASANITIYPVSHAMIMEQQPGDYGVRGSLNTGAEVVVDNQVYESRYTGVIEQYMRWI